MNLLSSCGPSHIKAPPFLQAFLAGPTRIMSVIVFAVKCEIRVGSWPHHEHESLELEQSCTNTYTSASVIFKGFEFNIDATLFHCSPNVVLKTVRCNQILKLWVLWFNIGMFSMSLVSYALQATNRYISATRTFEFNPRFINAALRALSTKFITFSFSRTSHKRIITKKILSRKKKRLVFFYGTSYNVFYGGKR